MGSKRAANMSVQKLYVFSKILGGGGTLGPFPDWRKFTTGVTLKSTWRVKPSIIGGSLVGGIPPLNGVGLLSLLCMDIFKIRANRQCNLQ